MHNRFAKKFIMMLLALGVTLAAAGMMSTEAYADTYDAADADTEISVTQTDEISDFTEPGADENLTDDTEDGSGEDPGLQEDPADQEDPEEIITGWNDGFYYDEEGNKVVSQIIEIDGLLYIFNARGDSDLLNDLWVDSDGKVYLIKEGVKDTASVYLYDGKLYKNGVLYSGGYQYVYYNAGVKSTANRNVVKKVEDGKFYYFDSSGNISRTTGWLRINNCRYYVKNGDVCVGWNYIDGYKYYFYSSTGYLCQDLIAENLGGIDWKSRVVLIKVNRTMNCVTLYANDGANGAIIPVKAIICSVGLPGTPTITGTYTLTASRTYRWSKLGGPTMGGYVWGQYCTRINGSYLFHSVTYRENQRPDTLVTSAYNNLGRAASHGCVRLQVEDAKLIYEIVRNHNVKVTIYDSNTVGPFDKPVISRIPAGQKWDPTDPDPRNPYR